MHAGEARAGMAVVTYQRPSSVRDLFGPRTVIDTAIDTAPARSIPVPPYTVLVMFLTYLGGPNSTQRLTPTYLNIIYKVAWFARWSVRGLTRDQLRGRVLGPPGQRTEEVALTRLPITLPPLNTPLVRCQP